MKKALYIILFGILGFTAQFLVHALVEMFYINRLLANYDLWGLGLSFDTWFTIHSVFTIVLMFLGIGLGIWQGFYWYPRLYTKEGKRL